MKIMLLVVLAIILFAGIASANDWLDLTDQKVQVNYSVGYQVGSDFKRQGMDINPDLLLKGVQDAMAGSQPLMNEQEMRTTLMELQKKVSAAREEKSKVSYQEKPGKGSGFSQ